MSWRERLYEFARYGVTGLLCLALNVFGVVLLTELLGLHYLLSLGITSGIVTITGFVLNKSWTFRQQGTTAVPEFLRYALTSATAMIIGMLSCSWLVEGWRVPYSLSVAIVGIGFAPLTYVVHRGWSFGLSWLYGKEQTEHQRHS